MSRIGRMCGGTSATQPATANIQDITDQVKCQLEEKTKKKYPIFKAVEFKSQVVAGTNYFIKVGSCGSPRSTCVCARVSLRGGQA
ncbi:cystatin-B [Pteropus alecto]|uniref:cystatin-B n=1 Tax=Pteropus alecto TaxID=9402 RepID=UPI0003F13956|nr:cystatin-B [Pteropus alecto]